MAVGKIQLSEAVQLQPDYTGIAILGVSEDRLNDTVSVAWCFGQYDAGTGEIEPALFTRRVALFDSAVRNAMAEIDVTYWTEAEPPVVGFGAIKDAILLSALIQKLVTDGVIAGGSIV